MNVRSIKYTLPVSSPLLNGFQDSMRRHYVDDFCHRHCQSFAKQALVLDVGGNKKSKRGRFNINQFSDNIIYLNYSPKYSPDLLADACALPFLDNSFDSIICTELLEHVRNPCVVLAEILRVLKPGGLALLTVPFMFPVHSDPNDYGRYTDQYWGENLLDIGFCQITIEWQGGCWGVLVDILRGFFIEIEQEYSGVKQKIANWLFVHCQKWVKIRATYFDSRSEKKTFFLKGCTTGFGIMCYKKR